ncbi:MAG: ABC transporter ATP-binding protein [Lachnospiraceae bacterium]|nr:ABC transporter ATP-binding protein [Lachnospiraceae bacterium]
MKRLDATDQIGYYFRKEKRMLLVVTVTGILYNVGMVAGPWFEGRMVQCLCDILGGNRQAMEMVTLVVCYVLVILFVQFMRCLKRLYVRKFANHISKSMKMTLYRNLLYRRREELEDAGAMMTKLISDADACVEGMRKFTTEVFDTGVVMVAYVGMLLFYDWRLTLLSMLFPPIAYFLAKKLKVVVTKNVALSRESSARLNAATLERITNALTYRIYGQESCRNAAYEENLTDYERKAVLANIWENAMQPIYQVISMLGAIVIIWFGGKNVFGTGWCAWNIATFTTFFSCYQKLALKSSKAAKLFNAVQKARVSWKRIRPYLAAAKEGPLPGALPLPDLSVRNVAFAYPGQETLFEGVTFQAGPGEIIGITGKIACGKSTLGKLMIGALPYQGEISLGNIIFSNHGERYEACVGYLGHQPELFDGTIEENICLGKPGDIGPVLCTVCIEQEVSALPEGIHTNIGSGGVRLSGGQQERIALARTLYHRKPLMVLDDPFSAVDMETEVRIFENLRRLTRDCVVLLISHRLSLFPQMDQVLWMENGRVSVGSHEGLMRENVHYRMLYEAQRKEDAPDEN